MYSMFYKIQGKFSLNTISETKPDCALIQFTFILHSLLHQRNNENLRGCEKKEGASIHSKLQQAD